MNRNVLFVDDDTKLLDGVARVLDAGFHLQLASSAGKGLELMQASSRFAVVVTDMRMPAMDGLQFIHEARRLAGDTVYMMLTGNQDLSTVANAVNEGLVYRFLTKPCPSRVLRNAVDDGIRQYDVLTGHREWVTQTFGGVLEVLVELLRQSHPDLFKRSRAVWHLVNQLLIRLNLPHQPECALAALLANVGGVAVVQQSGESHSDSEGNARQAIAQASKRLLMQIPRMEHVAEVIEQHARSTGRFPSSSTESSALVARGAALLRAAIELDAELNQGLSPEVAARHVSARLPELPEFVVDALGQITLP